MVAKIPLLTEDMDAEQRDDVVNEWFEHSDPVGDLINVSAHAILTESSELSETSSADLVSTLREVRGRAVSAGDELLTDGFKNGFSTLLEYRHQLGGKGILSEGLAGNDVRGSHYADVVDQCLRTIMVDLQCERSPFTTAECFGTETASRCADNGDEIQFCERVKPLPPDCLSCEVPDEPATFIGWNHQKRCWRVPKPCYHSLAYALHEDLDCYNATEIVRRDLNEVISDMRDVNAEKERISLMFGIPACSSCNDGSSVCHTWNYDGFEIPMYQPAGGCLWENTYIGCEFNPNPVVCPNNCQDPEIFRRRLKDIWRNKTDWNTDEPVECDFGPYEFFFPEPDCLAPHMEKMFGPFSLEHCIDGPCNAKIRSERPAETEIGGAWKTSRWARQCLVDFFLNNQVVGVDVAGAPVTIPVATNTATAEYRADNTYLLTRNWTSTFRQLIIDDFSRQISGTNHWDYFNRGTREAFRLFWGEKYLPFRPWLTSRFYAFDPTLVIP